MNECCLFFVPLLFILPAALFAAIISRSPLLAGSRRGLEKFTRPRFKPKSRGCR